MESVLSPSSSAFGARLRDRLETETVIWMTTVGLDGTAQPNPSGSCGTANRCWSITGPMLRASVTSAVDRVLRCISTPTAEAEISSSSPALRRLIQTPRGQMRIRLAAIRHAIELGTPEQRIAHAQARVAMVRVEEQDAIFPSYWVRAPKVRKLYRVVRLAGIEPAASSSAGMRSIR